MKPKFLILAVVLAALGAGAFYAFIPGRTPAGQPALAHFERAAFEQEFRGAAGETRLLVMLSPT